MSGSAGADDRRSSDRPMSSSADPSGARTINRSPPVTPIGLRSTPWAWARSVTAASCAAAYVTTTRDGPSPNSVTVSRGRPGASSAPRSPHNAIRADGQDHPTRSHVPGRGQEPPLGRRDEESVEGRFPRQVQLRQRVIGRRSDQVGEGAARQALPTAADEGDMVGVGRKRGTEARRQVVEQPDNTDLGRGRNGPARRRVVEADVATDDREAQGRDRRPRCRGRPHGRSRTPRGWSGRRSSGNRSRQAVGRR